MLEDDWKQTQQCLPSTPRTLRIFWPGTISNQHLLARCNQDSMVTIIMWQWQWRGESGNIPCAALHWTPEGKGTWGQPKNTWCWTTTEAGPEQTEWGTFAVALHASRHNGHEWASVFSLDEKISNLGPAVLTAPSLSQYSRVSASLRFCHKISSY